MVDQNAPHQLGSSPVELSAALPMGRMLANQLEISFVNQSSGLKGMARPLAPHIPAGQPFKLVIDQRNKLFLSGLVPFATSTSRAVTSGSGTTWPPSNRTRFKKQQLLQP